MLDSLEPTRLKRYAQVTRLLVKYGRGDLVEAAGLGDTLDAGPPVGDPATAEELADDLEALGPTFIKLGQLLATRPDLLPDPYITALERLQDGIAPMSEDEVVDTIVAELGFEPRHIFARFDLDPIGTASLGQVHRASLRDGREVAVKIQRPGVRAQVEDDLAMLSDLAGLLDRTTAIGRQVRFADLVSEFGHTLRRELDYRREAHNLRTVGENLADFTELVVPSPVDDLTTSRVLVMSWTPGRKVTDLSPVAVTDIDGRGLADALYRAYLRQILRDGVVHADPHPGNVLVTDDGRLALVDLGMVLRLDQRRREHLLHVVVAVAEGDTRRVAETSVALSTETDDFDRGRFDREVSALLGTFLELPPGELELGRLLLKVTQVSSQCGLRPAPELSVLGRTLLALDQVGRTLQPDYDAHATIREEVTRLATSAMANSASSGSALQALMDTKRLVEELPRHAERIVSDLAAGEFTVKVDAFDETQLMRGIQKLANRVTVGILLASLIIGAAMLSRVETSGTILGYPSLAIVFFLIAATGGVWLAASILLNDRRDRH